MIAQRNEGFMFTGKVDLYAISQAGYPVEIMTDVLVRISLRRDHNNTEVPVIRFGTSGLVSWYTRDLLRFAQQQKRRAFCILGVSPHGVWVMLEDVLPMINEFLSDNMLGNES